MFQNVLIVTSSSVMELLASSSRRRSAKRQNGCDHLVAAKKLWLDFAADRRISCIAPFVRLRHVDLWRDGSRGPFPEIRDR